MSCCIIEFYCLPSGRLLAVAPEQQIYVGDKVRRFYLPPLMADYLEGNLFKLYAAIAALCFSSLTFAYQENGKFPIGPDPVLTPGALCERPTARRYPEHIAYCERNVSSEEKREIFQKYDQTGFRTREMQRGAFKIDHLIPLCMGGSNSAKNLWPQHESIYNITDPLEPVLCDKMAQGRLKQQKAVEIILYAKAHLDEVPKILRDANNL